MGRRPIPYDKIRLDVGVCEAFAVVITGFITIESKRDGCCIDDICTWYIPGHDAGPDLAIFIQKSIIKATPIRAVLV